MRARPIEADAPAGWAFECRTEPGDPGHPLKASPVAPAVFRAYCETLHRYRDLSSLLAFKFARRRTVTIDFELPTKSLDFQPVFSVRLHSSPIRTAPAFAALICTEEIAPKVVIRDEETISFVFGLQATQFDPGSRWLGAHSIFPWVPERVETAVWAQRAAVTAERASFTSFLLTGSRLPSAAEIVPYGGAR